MNLIGGSAANYVGQVLRGRRSRGRLGNIRMDQFCLRWLWHSLGGAHNGIEAGASFASIGGGRENSVQAHAEGRRLRVGVRTPFRPARPSRASVVVTAIESRATANMALSRRWVQSHRSECATRHHRWRNGNRIHPNAEYATVRADGLIPPRATASPRAAGKGQPSGRVRLGRCYRRDFSSIAENQFRVRAAGGLEVVGGADRPALRYSATRAGDRSSPGGLAENFNGAGMSAPALRVVNYGGDSVHGALAVDAYGTGNIATFGNASTILSSLSTDGTWTAAQFSGAFTGSGAGLTSLVADSLTPASWATRASRPTFRAWMPTKPFMA